MEAFEKMATAVRRQHKMATFSCILLNTHCHRKCLAMASDDRFLKKCLHFKQGCDTNEYNLFSPH